jgi:hypothetical protein
MGEEKEMSGDNLPPGITPDMIPGNQAPQDPVDAIMELEELEDILEELLDEYYPDMGKWHNFTSKLKRTLDIWGDEMYETLKEIREDE